MVGVKTTNRAKNLARFYHAEETTGNAGAAQLEPIGLPAPARARRMTDTARLSDTVMDKEQERT